MMIIFHYIRLLILVISSTRKRHVDTNYKYSFIFVLNQNIVIMTSSNENIFRVTGPLCGEFTGEFPRKKDSDAELWFYFDLRLNKRLNKQSRRRWFETSSRSLWRCCNVRLFSYRSRVFRRERSMQHGFNSARDKSWICKTELGNMLRNTPLTYATVTSKDRMASQFHGHSTCLFSGLFWS